MSIFVDFIQPLINWLHANPHWALLITFLMSLAESFAIIGSIVPGSVTMTAVGILAGSGIIRIDLTLLAATLGAIFGDTLSYALGYIFSDKITDIWPFSKYPKWLTYGKEFFSKHGGKSVFLGRFIGPLRSIIPIIAGIMHMSHWRFFLANATSAVGWSLLYVLPGVLIGAASAELSAETATRLFIVILLGLVGIWLISLLFKLIFNIINKYFKENLHPFWLSLKKHPHLYQFFHLITPTNEVNHYPTVMLLAISLLAFFGFILFMLLQISPWWMAHVNLPVFLLIKSFHTPSLQLFYILCAQLTNVLTLFILFFTCFIWFLWTKKNALIYLLFLIIISSLIAYLSAIFLAFFEPQTTLPSDKASFFSAINIAIGTAFYSFIYFYTTYHFDFLTNTLRSVVFAVLGFSGLGIIALGDAWITELLAAYCCGLVVASVHFIIYRKSQDTPVKKYPAPLVFCLILLTLLSATGISSYLNVKTEIENHTSSHKLYLLTENQWWNQSKPILPLYLFNRIGKRIGLLNLQYYGDLNFLQSELIRNGWELHTETFFTKVLQLMNSKSNSVKLPLLDLLFDNKRPELIMTLNDAPSKIILELRFWKSDYYLKDLNSFLWIGNIRERRLAKNKAVFLVKSIDPAAYLQPALNEFTVRKVALSKNTIQSTTSPLQPYILLIK